MSTRKLQKQGCDRARSPLLDNEWLRKKALRSFELYTPGGVSVFALLTRRAAEIVIGVTQSGDEIGVEIGRF